MQPILELIGTRIHLLVRRDKRSVFLVFYFTMMEQSLIVLAGVEPGSCTMSDQRPNHYTTETIPDSHESIITLFDITTPVASNTPICVDHP